MKLIIATFVFAFASTSFAEQQGESTATPAATTAKPESKDTWVVCKIGCNLILRNNEKFRVSSRIVANDVSIKIPLNAKRQLDLESPDYIEARQNLFKDVKSKCDKMLKDGIARVEASTMWTTGADQQGLTNHFGIEDFNEETGKFRKVQTPTLDKSCGISPWSLKNRPWTDDGSG